MRVNRLPIAAMIEEVNRLRRMAADLVEQFERRERPISPEEDAQILMLLTQAEELEQQLHRKSAGNRFLGKQGAQSGICACPAR